MSHEDHTHITPFRPQGLLDRPPTGIDEEGRTLSQDFVSFVCGPTTKNGITLHNGDNSSSLDTAIDRR